MLRRFFFSLITVCFFVIFSLIFFNKLNFFLNYTRDKQEIDVNKENFSGKLFYRISKDIIKPLVFDQIRKYIVSHKIDLVVAQNFFPNNFVDISENRRGVGNRVFCGQKVKILVYGYTKNPVQVFHQRSNGLFDVRVGMYNISKAIDVALSGMRVGGERTVSLPESMPINKIFDNVLFPAKKEIFYDIELIDVIDYKDFDVDKLFFFKKNIVDINKSSTCGCGVYFDMVIESLNGDVIYNKNNLKTTIGSFEFPIATELGLENMPINSAIKVIAPIKFLQTRNGFDEKFGDFKDYKNVLISLKLNELA